MACFTDDMAFSEVFMASSSALHSHLRETQVWMSLRQAIAESSGFQRWQLEQDQQDVQDQDLDELVRRYLRETLETLAY
jgi:hypothetical protein